MNTDKKLVVSQDYSDGYDDGYDDGYTMGAKHRLRDWVASLILVALAVFLIGTGYFR